MGGGEVALQAGYEAQRALVEMELMMGWAVLSNLDRAKRTRQGAAENLKRARTSGGPILRLFWCIPLAW
jgi:hypothetical protein